jgi:hypothetical protein
MITKLTFGSDPEYFVTNEQTKRIISAIPLIEGTKESPESLGDGYFIQRDNVLAEGNVPPVLTKEAFIYVMKELKDRIIDYLRKKYSTLGLVHADCMSLDHVFLSHPEAMQFGCSPNLNAWDKEIHKAKDMSEECFRTAGFHIHCGYETDGSCIWNKETINMIIARAYDLFVILPSCMISVDQRRFENYGGLGQYRDTSYGLELRSLGAFFADPSYISWVFDQLQKAMEYVNNEENIYKLMYLAKPETRFKSGIFTFDSSIYDDLDISFNDQLIESKKTIYA